MKTWLHFVGKSFYKLDAFVQEACRYGVSRRVARNVLEKMHFGDRVLLAQHTGKGAIVFGEFTIRQIFGLSEAASARVHERFETKVVDSEPMPVERECGSYMVTGATIIKNVDIPDILSVCQDLKDIGKLMIGGQLRLINPRYILASIDHRMGFREINYQGVQEALQNEKKRKESKHVKDPIHKIDGQFYVFKDTPEEQEAPRRVPQYDHDISSVQIDFMLGGKQEDLQNYLVSIINYTQKHGRN